MNFLPRRKNAGKTARVRGSNIPLGFILAILATAFFLPRTSEAQQNKRPNVRVQKINTYYYESGVLKAIFGSESVKPLSGPHLLAQQFHMRSVKDGDEKKTELVIEAPECVYNTDNHTASSHGPLRVYNAETNFLIEGVGFLSVVNSNSAQLTISNKIHTYLKVGTNAITESTNALRINSDRFFFYSPLGTNIARSGTNIAGRTATYRENVRVEDNDYVLTCSFLRAELPDSGNALKSLVADGGVALVNKKDGSRAFGKRAYYKSVNGRELIYLEGEPRWEELSRTATGDLFVFDKTARTIEIQTNALVHLIKVPMQQFSALGPTTADTNPTNIRITADHLFIELPATNGGVAGKLEAVGNTQILSDDGKVMGKSPRVRFLPRAGELQMEERAKLRVGSMEIHGNLVEVNVSNKVVRSKGSSFLRLPAESFLQSALNQTNAAAEATNVFLEIFSDSFDYNPEQAVFLGSVSANYLFETNLLAILDAGYLRMDFGANNHLALIVSTNEVKMKQFAVMAAVSNTFERDFKAERLQLKFVPGGQQLHSFLAETGVIFKQRNLMLTNVVVQQIEAGSIYGVFDPVTNLLSRALMESNVRFSQNENVLTGQKAVYSTGTNKTSLHLTGKPEALLFREDKGKTNVIRLLDSDTFVWNPDDGTFKATGRWRAIPEKSNFPSNSRPK